MKLGLICLILAWGIVLQGTAATLPRSTPEAQGVKSEAIAAFLKKVQALDSLHGMMLVRHGQVIAEGWWAPYGPDKQHKLFSLSKSFTSTAVGLAIAEGKMTLHDTVVSFFPDQLPAEPSWQLKAMRVRDLLSMSTGHVQSDLKTFSFQSDEVLTKAFLALPVEHKPGTHFLYNTPATYMCAAIVEKVTGEKLVDYLQPRLFGPLGIKNPRWDESPQGIALGGYGLKIRTEDIARLGQLYLQQGKWQGQQLIPADWVAQATAKQTSNGSDPNNDWDQGYGFQFWRCRHNAYRGDGAFGQYCVVMPEQDAVLAINSGLNNMQAVLDAAWDTLLPGMQSTALAENTLAHESLTTSLSQLVLPMPKKSESSLQVSGNRYVFDPNDLKLESLTLHTTGELRQLRLEVDGEEHVLPLGDGAWVRGTTTMRLGMDRFLGHLERHPIAGSGAWTKSDAFTAKVALTETPFVVTYQLSFGDDSVEVEPSANVAFGPKKGPILKGKLQSDPGNPSLSIARAYPDDVGIAQDQRVIFADNFDRDGEVVGAWDEARNKDGKVLSLSDGTLKVVSNLDHNTGGGLTKWFESSHRVHVRFYVKFAEDCDYIHHFVTLRANKGLQGKDRWSGFGGAGNKPDGLDRFSTALEPWGDWGKLRPPGTWNFYSYWHEMKAAPDGKYWGNSFKPDKRPLVSRGDWICAEFMLKHNTPGQADGEQAFWIDGELQGHWKDISWRKNASLQANALTLESYVTDRWTKQKENTVWFDNVVIAKDYVGPMATAP